MSTLVLFFCVAIPLAITAVVAEFVDGEYHEHHLHHHHIHHD